MYLSIIIPAFNEERLICQCLDSVSQSLTANQKAGLKFEVIVTDNNSTDQTAKLAKNAGAQVVFEPINQIGRARNVGASIAKGDWLLFLDADSLLSPGLLADIINLIESGRYVGCGSVMQMPGSPWWGTMILKIWTFISITFHWASGALVVCRTDAFREIGGFNQDLYAADEITLSRQLKTWGRKHRLGGFTILKKYPLVTSARKLKLYSGREILNQCFYVLKNPKKALQSKTKLPIWYDGRR